MVNKLHPTLFNIGCCLTFTDLWQFYRGQIRHKPLTEDVLVLCTKSEQSILVFHNLGDFYPDYFHLWYVLSFQVHVVALFNSSDYLNDRLLGRPLLHQLFVGLVPLVRILRLLVRIN